MSTQDPSDYKTGDAVPSNKATDLNDNAKVFDVFQNAQIPSVKSRLGVEIKTVWQQGQEFDQNVDNWNNTFNAQFSYKYVKSFAEANSAGEKITDATRLNAYSTGTAPNLEWYGLIQSTTIPPGGLDIPAVPDDNWVPVDAVKLNQMRTDSASQLGLVYLADWYDGLVIPNDAMLDKLAVWYSGKFYSVGTDTGFTSNDFDADLYAGKFVDRFTLSTSTGVNHIATTELMKTYSLGVGDKVSTDGFYNQNDGGGATFIIYDTSQNLPHIVLDNGLFAVYQERQVKLRQIGVTAEDEVNIARNTQIACDFYNEYGYLVDDFVDGDDDRLNYYFRDAEIFIKRNGQALNNFNFICVGDTKTTPVINFADVTDGSGRKIYNFYFTKIVNMRFTQVEKAEDIANFTFTNTRDLWSTDITKPVATRYNCPNTTINNAQIRGFKCAFRLAGWQWSMDTVTLNNPLISACLVGTSLNATNFYTVAAKYSVALGCDYNPDTDTAVMTNEGLAYSTFNEMPNDQITDAVVLLGRTQGVSIDGFGVEQFARNSPEYSKGIIKIAPQNGPSVFNIKGGAFYLPNASQCIFDATNVSSDVKNTTTVNITGVALREADNIFVNNDSGNVVPIFNGNDEFNSVAGSNHYGSTHVNVDSRCEIMPPAMRNNYYVQFNAQNQDARIDEYQLNATIQKTNKLRIPFGRAISTSSASIIMIKADIFPLFSGINGSTQADLNYGELIIHCYQYNSSSAAILNWKFNRYLTAGPADKITVTQGKYDESDDLYIEINIDSTDVTETSMIVGYVRSGSNYTKRRKISNN